MEFENKIIEGIHATRYIMSWVREGGQLGRRGEGIDDFHEWLLSLGLTDDEAREIEFIAMNGKLELETSARAFLKQLNN